MRREEVDCVRNLLPDGALHVAERLALDNPRPVPRLNHKVMLRRNRAETWIPSDVPLVKQADPTENRLASVLQSAAEHGLTPDELGDAVAKLTQLEQSLSEARA